MRSRRLLPLLGFLGLMFASCASQESFRVPVMRPAPVDLGQNDLVALDRFTGNGGDVLSEELAAALRQAVNPLSGKADFELVDRRDVDRMVDDMRRYPDAKLDTEDSPVAKWKRARLTLKGDVQQYSVEEQTQATRFVDPQGVRHTAFERQAAARVAVTIEALEQDGSRVFDRAPLDECQTAATKAVDSEPVPIDHDALLAAARQRVVEQYLRRVMPHVEYVTISMYTDGDLPQLEVGNGYARTGDWNAALQSYGQALAAATGDLGDVRYKALYNQGVAQLYQNRFEEARRSLQDAYAQEQDKMILGQLNTVSRREQEFAALQQQGQRTPAQPGQ